MNAIEHGNAGPRASSRSRSRSTPSTACSSSASPTTGRGGPSATEAEVPDLEAKLAGLQKPRGWGLFLIENMVDELRVVRRGRPAHGRARPATWKEAAMMATAELRGARPRRGRRRRCIELIGDVDGRAEAALDAAYAQARRARPACCSTSAASTYMNSTGIALIVGLLARARNERPDAQRGWAVRALPRDLRDHPAGRLHDDRRRRGGLGMTAGRRLSMDVRRIDDAVVRSSTSRATSRRSRRSADGRLRRGRRRTARGP